jgi:hypothetical protein
MLRRVPSETAETIPDRELGVAALILLVSIFLSAAILPTFM